MSTTDMIRGRVPHGHQLGGTEWAAKAIGVGGMSRCSCGRWFVLRCRHAESGWYQWVPVRWYNLGLRRKIAES